MRAELLVAELGSTHGLAGEMLIRSLSGEYSHIRSLRKVCLQKDSNILEEHEIISLRGQGKKHIVRFQDIHNREQAACYTGAKVVVKREHAQTLMCNEFYYGDLSGCRIIVQNSDRGKVRSVWHNAHTDMLEIELNNGKIVQVPFLKQFVNVIDLHKEEIHISAEWILE